MYVKNYGAYGIHSVFSISICFFAISTWLSLSDIIKFEAEIFKYISILMAFFIALTLNKKGKSDLVSVGGLSFFIFTLFFFTVMNITSFQDIFVFSGYMLCYFLYYFLSKTNSKIQLNLRNYLFYLGGVFIILNGLYVFDASAYSFGKGQFKGFYSNANAFTGLCGLFFVLNFSVFSTTEEKFKKSLCLILMAVLSVYLILGNSRGAILSTAVASFFLLITSRNKKMLIFSCSLLVIFLIVFKDSLFTNVSDRDIFEETGRQTLFLNYWAELQERYFYIGTGVSLDAGRIKSELSYPDVFLMSGFVGFIGFIGFIIRTLYLSFSLINKDSVWLAAVYIYIVFASIFEGYAANIMSLNSLLFYIIPALIYSSYVKLVKSK